MISCKKNTVVPIQNIPLNSNSKIADTTIIKSGVYLLNPDVKEIDSLKKNKGEENFYTIADDSNFYISKISDLLKMPLINITKRSVNFKNENLVIRKKDEKSIWMIIDYKSGTAPQKYSLVEYYTRISKSPQNVSTDTGVVDKYMKNDKYFSVDMDVNNDGLTDKIFSNKIYKGDSLIIFFKQNDKYILKLSTINLSQDGGQQISQIVKNSNGFSIFTAFPKGTDNYNYLVSYKNDDFIIEKVIHKVESWQDKSQKKCEFKPKVSLKLPSTEIFEKLAISEDDKKCF